MLWIALPDGTKAIRNLTVRQVEHAIIYVTIASCAYYFALKHMDCSDWMNLPGYNMHKLLFDYWFAHASLGNRSNNQRDRDEWSILTDIEISELVLWIGASNDNNCGKTRHGVSLKIRQILIARKNALSKTYDTDRHILQLTRAENNKGTTSKGTIYVVYTILVSWKSLRFVPLL